MRVLLSWSSGKDSAWALHILRQTPGIEVAGLLTTINRSYDRVTMHAVRRTLLERQAEAVGLELHVISIPWPCSNTEYDRVMTEACSSAEANGFEAVAFGDLFLEDVRKYREQQLANTRLRPLFPLWGIPTGELARQMIYGGLRAKLTCIDPKHLSSAFAGKEYSLELLRELPPTVDPCGENGEFHSFVYDGPMFSKSVPVAVGQIVNRDGFFFADVVPPD